MQRLLQTALGFGVLAVAAALAYGAAGIRAEAGYGGVGPNFLPWVVALALAGCGAALVWQARRGGFEDMAEPSGSAHGHWPGFAWVSVGILLNALLITTLGFILSCALCFALAVQGLKSAEGMPQRSVGAWLGNLAIGAAIAAPVYWMFTKALAINLPGLTQTGWL